MKIGQRIRERRKSMKMSVDELAARLGKDRSTVYRYENGEIENLPLDMLEPIAKALDMNPKELMGWDQSEKEEINKKNSDAMSDITNRMFRDEDFFRVVKFLETLDAKQFKRVKVSLNNLFEEAFDIEIN